MAELSVIIILALIAISTAGWTVVQLARLVPVEAEEQRLKRALQSAADGIARRQLKLTMGALTLQVVGCLGLGRLLFDDVPLWLTLGMLVGTGAVFVLSQLSLNWSIHSASAAGRLAHSGDSAVVVSLRSSAALMLFSGAAAVLLGACALAAVRLAEFTSTLALLQGAVLGALSGGLLLHATGSSLRVAGVTSRACANASGKQPFYCLDSSNPSLVLDLVAQHTGNAQSHTQRVFWAMSLQQVLALMLARGHQELGVALLSTVLLTQAVALLSSAVVQLALRTSDGVRTWSSALAQGLVGTNVMTLAALAGAGYWLLGDRVRVPELLAALLGAALTWVAVVLPARRAHQHRRLDENPDNQRRPALDLGFALPSALGGLATQVAALGLCVVALSYLAQGEQTLVGILWWWSMGAMLSLPYIAAQGLLEPLTECAASLAALRVDTSRGEPLAQLTSLCGVGQHAGGGSQRWFAVITALLVVVTLGYLSPTTTATAFTSHAVQGTLALVLVMGALGLLARRVATTALLGVNEVTRPRKPSDDPSSPGPGYAHYVELVSSHALHRSMWLAALLVVSIWGVVIGIGKWSASAPSSFVAPTTFLAFAAATGISVALLGAGIASYLGVARGFRRITASASAPQASDSLHTAHLGLAELAGSSLAPAALVLVHLIMAAILAFTPLLQ